MIVGDGEGRQLVEVHFAFAIEGHQLGTDRTELEPPAGGLEKYNGLSGFRKRGYWALRRGGGPPRGLNSWCRQRRSVLGVKLCLEVDPRRHLRQSQGTKRL